ncbi:MAG: hypothetical protein QNJ60_08535 [Xenococcaceae cyanobacterium MO_188.B19]|nr:hypothetical protein [Xenococcaceae cyanobacterium MO_188.B19]
MSKVPKIALSFAIAALNVLINGTMAASAATIKFELSFFDDNNHQVGSGEFSYDDRITTCFETSWGGDCNSPYEDFAIDVISVQNVLTDFSATVGGENWNSYYGYWWSDETSEQLPGYQSFSRYGIDIQKNIWFFGDLLFAERTLEMKINQSSNTFGTGSWQQYLATEISEYNEDGFIITSGSWEAAKVTIEPQSLPTKIVPEPSTFPGALFIMGFACYVKRKPINKIN